MTSDGAREMGRTCLFFAVRRAARAVGRRYDTALKPLGINANQLTVLAILHALGPMTVGELADNAWVDTTTMSRTVHRLRRDGNLALRAGQDRRTRQVALTEAGRERLESAHAVWKRVQAELGAGLPADLVATLRRLERASDKTG